MWNFEHGAYHLHAVSWANLQRSTEMKSIKMDKVRGSRCSLLFYVVRMNEQAFRNKRSYANTGMCCATEENHEKFIRALPGYKPRPVTLRYPARFVLLCAVHGYSL